jgi:hypothetical protein
MAMNAMSSKVIALLIEAGKTDTVYRDVYLRRARELLSPTLDESAYRAIGSMQKDVDELVRRTRSAVLQHDWTQASELSGQADQKRKSIDALASVAAIANDVYSEIVVFDPFSPGKHLGAHAQAMQAGLRTQLVETLLSLAKLDSSIRAFYEERRAYFSGLQIAASGDSQKTSRRSRGQLEQLALEAAERGDIAAVQSLAKELEHYKDEVEKNGFESGPSAKSQYECPFNIDSPLLTNANTRAQELGLVETHVPSLPEVRAAVEIIYAHAWHPTPSTPELEHEGVLRTEVLAESKVPAQFVTEEFKILAEQFIQQIFINSGGARYLPRISAETALVEDFAESEAADSPSQLLSALGLSRRRGLARAEIENALIRFGARIVADQLNLDPLEFWLVCIPYDLYMRLGRERDWGHWHHWTHFDGYQVVHGNRLRALVGGDGRFGGVTDLVSISRTDAHDSVYARFAVVRRARMVARWR